MSFGNYNSQKTMKPSRLLYKLKRKQVHQPNDRHYSPENSYILSLYTHYKQNFKTLPKEEQEAFLTQFFSTLQENLIPFSKNGAVSRMIEDLLLNLPKEELRGHLLPVVTEFLSADHLRVLCCDKYASHVVEKVVQVVLRDPEGDAFPLGLKIVKYVLNNFEEFAFEPYGSRVVRGVLVTLKKADAAGCDEELREFYTKIASWPQLGDLFATDLGCGFVQTLVEVYCGGGGGDYELLLNRITDSVPSIHNNYHLHVIEALLETIDNEDKWGMLYDKYLMTRKRDEGGEAVDFLVEFGLDERKKRRMLVNKVVGGSGRWKEKFQQIYQILSPHFSKLYEAGNTGIFVTLAEVCKKCKTLQGEFTKEVFALVTMGGAQAVDDDLMVEKILGFGSSGSEEEGGDGKSRITYEGSRLLQKMLGFHKPKKVTTSMLSLPAHLQTQYITHPLASHIFDAFFTSETIGLKDKEKMIVRLISSCDIVKLAVDKFGTRIVQRIVNSSCGNKSKVVELLLEKKRLLRDNFWGQFTLNSITGTSGSKTKDDKHKQIKTDQEDESSGTVIKDKKKKKKRKLEKEEGLEQEGAPDEEVVEDEEKIHKKKKKKRNQTD